MDFDLVLRDVRLADSAPDQPTTDIGVAAIPLSVFYDGGFEQRIVRLCFAKRDETLRLALDRLAKI